MVIYTHMKISKRITFYLPHKNWVDLNLHCILIDKTLSEFIRVAIQEKISKIKEQDEL